MLTESRWFSPQIFSRIIFAIKCQVLLRQVGNLQVKQLTEISEESWRDVMMGINFIRLQHGRIW